MPVTHAFQAAAYLNSGGHSIPSLSETLKKYSTFRQSGQSLPTEWRGVTNLPPSESSPSESSSTPDIKTDTSGVPAEAPDISTGYTKKEIDSIARSLLSKKTTGKKLGSTSAERTALKKTEEFKNFLDANEGKTKEELTKTSIP